MALRIRNWDEFQHYKDRNPPWIKLHKDLLTSEQWVLANDSQRVLIIAIMLLAARKDNSIPADPDYIQKVAHLDSRPDLDWLVSVGFCENCAEDDQWQSPWPSRHVSEALRSEILLRDGSACVFCGSTESLEIDHIIPVSKGGDSNPQNLQVLCRSCNRKKRTRVANATRSVADATQHHCSAYTETETEEETETEKRQRPRARFTPPTVDEVRTHIAEKGYTFDAESFVAYYTANGWKVGGRSAMKDWRAACVTWQKREGPKRASQHVGKASEDGNDGPWYPEVKYWPEPWHPDDEEYSKHERSSEYVTECSAKFGTRGDANVRRWPRFSEWLAG